MSLLASQCDEISADRRGPVGFANCWPLTFLALPVRNASCGRFGSFGHRVARRKADAAANGHGDLRESSVACSHKCQSWQQRAHFRRYCIVLETEAVRARSRLAANGLDTDRAHGSDLRPYRTHNIFEGRSLGRLLSRRRVALA